MPRRLLQVALWLLDQTHIVVTGITAITFLTNRSAHVGYFITGAVLCNSIAKVSKRLIKQERPVVVVEDTNDDRKRPKKKTKRTYGMPSTHSTSISFFMSYIVLSLPPFSRSITDSLILGLTLSLGTIAWGTAIMWSRVKIGYHTLAQVLVGAAIGLTGGAVWRWIWDEYVREEARARRTGRSLEARIQGLIDGVYGAVGL